MKRPNPRTSRAMRHFAAAWLAACVIGSAGAAPQPAATPSGATGASAAPPTVAAGKGAGGGQGGAGGPTDPDHSASIPHPPAPAGRSAFDQRPIRTDIAPARSASAATAPATAPAAPTLTRAPFDFQRVLGALAIVLGLIFALRWVLRRSMNPAALPRASGTVQVLTRSPLSPRQQLLLLRVGRRLLVVADCNGQLNALSEITDPNEVAALVGQLRDEKLTAASRSFGNLLGMWRRGDDESAADDEADPGREHYPRAAPEVLRRRAAADGDDVDETDTCDAGADESGADESDAPSVASARDEIHGLTERVRLISHQFKR